MKAIITKYIPATNTKGSRISASDCDGNRVTVAYDTQLSGMDCYSVAAQALVDKMGWPDLAMIGGAIKGGYAFVFMPTI